MQERIISVAISAFGIIASLPAPARHGDILRKLWDFQQIPLGPDTQGFLTTTGRYVNRVEAAEIAQQANQLFKPLITAPNLYSEDLW